MPTNEKILFSRRGAALGLSKKGDRKMERVVAVPVREDPAADLTQVEEPLGPAELDLLREFFELLAEWDESLKGEPGDG